jgi:hypothetical protein
MSGPSCRPRFESPPDPAADAGPNPEADPARIRVYPSPSRSRTTAAARATGFGLRGTRAHRANKMPATNSSMPNVDSPALHVA